ncbi:MAG: hypothetical protein QOC81_4271 [Thermoanaerobaculia bacterium]|jgi:hypothetical protein|nr:hypothetical protein [Thermoanaerobaculia bacterium]
MYEILSNSSAMDLTQPPPTLTPRQRLAFWSIAFVCAATRFLAMARSLWDWDEALFCLGMRSYDVTVHHPHPPGFPVYIALGRVVRTVIPSDFRALQAVNLVAGMLVFPAIFFLARELRFRFVTAAVAAALCAFFPNVWFFGGGAFSDIPSLVLVVLAVAFLFRGCRDANAYLLGAALLALAAGIRPQNFLIGLAPGALATWYRARVAWRDVVFAALVGAITIGVAFGGAIAATGGSRPYFDAAKEHGEYITRVDSFQSPTRPALWRLFDRFFIKQYQSLALSFITSILVAISIAGAIASRDRAIGWLALTFAPFAVLAWMMLDRYSINRFSIGYCPLFAILAADGIARLTRRWPRWEAVAGAALVASFFAWTLPALASVRNTIAPSVLAVEAVRDHLDPRSDQLFVARNMDPFFDYLLPNQPYVHVLDERAMPLSLDRRNAWILAEADAKDHEGFVFHRERDHLWNIARRHYFDAGLMPIRNPPQFLSGWYPAEQQGPLQRRAMSAHSVTKLPASNGDSILRIQFRVPAAVSVAHATVTISLNGRVLDRFAAPLDEDDREYHVTPSANGGPNVLELSIDGPLDSRGIALSVTCLSFGPE